MKTINFKEKLNNIIAESNLENSKKRLWDCFLKISKSDEDEAIFEAVNESHENLILLSGYLHDKIKDMKNESRMAFEKKLKNK